MYMMTHEELVIEFAKTWNNLDSSYIRELLAPDFHYASQWVFSEIESKNKFLEYLEGKLKAVADSGDIIIAEVGNYWSNYCLVLTQFKNGSNKKVTFLIETKDGQIVRADLCCIPCPEDIEMLGIIPK